MGWAARRSRPAPPSRAALHEAGHAVAAVVLGYELVKVTLEPDAVRGWHGQTWIVHPDYRVQAVRQRHAIFCLAGSFAEIIHRQTEPLMIYQDDVSQLEEWGIERSGAMAASARFIDAHRLVVVRVARALEIAQTLTGDEVRRLCEGVRSYAMPRSEP